MNLLLVEPSEREEPGLARVDGRRARHLRRVLGKGVGDSLRVGEPASVMSARFPELEPVLARCFERKLSIRREVEALLSREQVPRNLVVHYGYVPQDVVAMHIEDVTAQHQVQQQLKASQRLEAVARLAGGIAHDFNNLLSGMLGGVGLLRRLPELGERGQSYVDLMEQSMLRAADLSKRLRLLTHTTTGSRTAFRPKDLAARVAHLIERGTSGRRTVSVEVEDEAQGYFLGDVGLLEQALLNLALNAQHATDDDGHITLRLALQQPPPGSGGGARDHLVLSVRDDGCGIPAEMQSRVFEPFFTTRSPEEGTGLGLAMVHAAATDHGGFVQLESSPGEGTLVSMWIPAEPASESMVPAEAQREQLPTGHGRVLVVDDRDGPLLATKSVLHACGYDVALAWSGEAALKMTAHDEFDLIITDSVMPTMGGRELLRQLRASGFRGPVILMSGQHEEVEDARGFVATLEKPVAAHVLALAVHDALDDGLRDVMTG